MRQGCIRTETSDIPVNAIPGTEGDFELNIPSSNLQTRGAPLPGLSPEVKSVKNIWNQRVWPTAKSLSDFCISDVESQRRGGVTQKFCDLQPR